jgi:hypothetical protein
MLLKENKEGKKKKKYRKNNFSVSCKKIRLILPDDLVGI